MSDEKVHGEGNHAADRNYRQGVARTVKSTDEQERAECARSMTESERRAAKKAASKTRAKARQ